jgi:hypothetical protein
VFDTMRGAPIGIAVVLALLGSSPALTQSARPSRPTPVIRGPLNTIKDVQNAIKRCWVWPPLRDIGQGMNITVLLSFKRNGEIFGGRITYQTPNVSDDLKAVYYRALAAMIRRCSPLLFSDSLGAAIAGRLFTFQFIDDRKQRRA